MKPQSTPPKQTKEQKGTKKAIKPAVISPKNAVEKPKRKVTSLKRKRQIAVIENLKKTYGNITLSCDAIPITRKTYYEWYKKDKWFKNEIDTLQFEERNLDMAENQLRKLMLGGNPASIIFYLKTKGRCRGYIENTFNIENFNQQNISIDNVLVALRENRANRSKKLKNLEASSPSVSV